MEVLVTYDVATDDAEGRRRLRRVAAGMQELRAAGCKIVARMSWCRFGPAKAWSGVRIEAGQPAVVLNTGFEFTRVLRCTPRRSCLSVNSESTNKGQRGTWLHLIQPPRLEAPCRREMDVRQRRIRGQEERFTACVLSGGVVVHHQACRSRSLGTLPSDCPNGSSGSSTGLAVPVRWQALPDDRTGGGHVEGCEQRHGAGDVCNRACVAPQCPGRMGTGASRVRSRPENLAFFIDAQHQGTLGRRQVQADDVAHLVDEQGLRWRGLKVSMRCGCNAKARQMRWMVEGAWPTARAMERRLQWVASGGVSSRVRRTTSLMSSSLMRLGVPGRGSS